jgi:tetratricopeptide (TPR) repeat protein
MVSAFEKMEAAFDEHDLGMACLKLGVRLDSEGEDPEKVRTFALRALKVFDNDKLALPIPLAMSLQLLGSSYFSSRKFNDALGVLNRANRVITNCNPTESEGWGELGPGVASRILPYKDTVHHAIQNDLSNVKSALGRREEAIEHLVKCLEIKEKLLGENDKEIGGACRHLAEAYVELLRFKEALPICLKAVDIHTSQLGRNSVEVAHDRRLLGIIYTGLEQHEKALEENQSSQKIMKRWGLNDELRSAEIDAANMNIVLGRDEEAINDMKNAVRKTKEDSQDRALILVTMGKALCNLERFNESKNCFQMARAILDKKQQMSPDLIVECYMEISTQYETMNEFETAISLLETAKSILEKNPEEHLNLGGVLAKIGGLLHLTGKVKDALPYLEEAIERLIESFGDKYYGVGYIYNNLGAAYMELDRPQSAARALQLSKTNMEVSLGPYHVDTIDTTQNLAKAYSAMGR